MGFPQVFYCVCEAPGCPWNRPGSQIFDRIVVCVVRGETHRHIEPDDRVVRITGSPYWNTCVFYRLIVFEAIFIRTLRRLVRDGTVPLDALLEVLDYLVRRPRRDRRFVAAHASAIQRIAGELGYLESMLGPINGNFHEIFRLVQDLVFRNRALLDVEREPRYWPTRDAALEAMRRINSQRRFVRGHTPASQRVA